VLLLNECLLLLFISLSTQSGNFPIHPTLAAAHASTTHWKNTRVYPKVSGLSCLERELQMVQISGTKCNRIAILWVSLVSFAAIIFCVASQRVFIVVRVYFVIDSVRKLLDTPSYPCELQASCRPSLFDKSRQNQHAQPLNKTNEGGMSDASIAHSSWNDVASN
jgi:hypothetical protein